MKKHYVYFDARVSTMDNKPPSGVYEVGERDDNELILNSPSLQEKLRGDDDAIRNDGKWWVSPDCITPFEYSVGDLLYITGDNNPTGLGKHQFSVGDSVEVIKLTGKGEYYCESTHGMRRYVSEEELSEETSEEVSEEPSQVKMYFVLCLSSDIPPTTAFRSYKQACYVARKMSEEHKDTFYVLEAKAMYQTTLNTEKVEL